MQLKKQVLSLLFLIYFVLGISQNKKTIFPNFIGQNLSEIENNSDWKVLQKSIGDLNKDELNDVSLILGSKVSILEKRCPDCKLLKSKPRIIVVLINNETKIQNNKFIARGNEGGMLPYLEPKLIIKDGFLSINYQFTRGNQSYTFEYLSNKLLITEAENNGVHSASGNFENDKYDFKTGKIISKIGNISEEKIITKIITFDIKPKSLSEFGKMNEWEIAEDKYL